jgi:hypothetical protein
LVHTCKRVARRRLAAGTRCRRWPRQRRARAGDPGWRATSSSASSRQDSRIRPGPHTGRPARWLAGWDSARAIARSAASPFGKTRVASGRLAPCPLSRKSPSSRALRQGAVAGLATNGPGTAAQHGFGERNCCFLSAECALVGVRSGGSCGFSHRSLPPIFAERHGKAFPSRRR